MKIEKVFLKVILAILIIFIFFVYRVTLFIPQKINLENIKPIQINEKFEIIDISKNEKMIGSKIDVNYMELKEFYNYVLGEGTGIDIDYSIIVKIKDEYFKLKTKMDGYSFDSSNENVYIEFKAFVNNKYLSDEIFILNNDTNELFVLKGGSDEK